VFAIDQNQSTFWDITLSRTLMMNAERKVDSRDHLPALDKKQYQGTQITVTPLRFSILPVRHLYRRKDFRFLGKPGGIRGDALSWLRLRFTPP